jgi:uncharacterized membrane protein YgaE (UPF0421/DUF939 family)
VAHVDTLREAKLFSRVRTGLIAGLGRLREHGWPTIQTAVAAGVAYFLVTLVVSGQQAFYAPIAAVVCLSLSLGQPWRRVLLVTIGVTIGLGLASLIVLGIGGGAAQIGLVVALAMGTAVLFTDRKLMANQAANSAILVVVLQPPQETGFSPERFIDALVGGVVALAVNYLLPADPERMAEKAARPFFGDLARTLKEVAAALKDSDHDRAEGALSRARGMDEQVSSLRDTLAAAQETARYSPLKRRELGHLQLYADEADRLDLVVGGVQSLARAAVGAARHGSPASGPLSESVLDLSRGVRALGNYLANPGDPEDVRRCALDAAYKATQTLKESRANLDTSAIVGQIRTTTLDLLMSTDMHQDSAVQVLEEIAGSASELN